MKKIKLSIISLALIIAILLSGCQIISDFGFSNTPAPTTAPTPTSTPGPINPTYSAPPPAPPTITGILLTNIADVVAKVRPSVVAINTEIIAYDIFNRPRTQQGAGSGWIIDPSGLIATNNHVVQDAQTVTVTMENGQTYTAKTIRTDPINDLAVIDIGTGNLPALTVGDSSRMRVGDWVVAIGNALGQGVRATQGIISNTGINITVDTGETLYNLLETTAAINPGNSGGPLVNMAGQVIGITSVKISAAGVEGMGYAIASNTVQPIIQELIQKGYVSHPYFGISVTNINQLLTRQFNLAVDKGALIVDIAAGGPADKAGLKIGDVIVKINSKDVNNADDAVQGIRSSKIGQPVQVTYYRGNNQGMATVIPVEAPPPSP